jgi:phosphatidyl-myo-inositol dimannoside synthase
MKYLLIVPDLGFLPSGNVSPGGLANFGRCVARALASSPSIEQLSIWDQLDLPTTKDIIERMVNVYAHPGLQLDVRCFGGSKVKLASAVAWACLRKRCDYVMYLLVNQSVLTTLPWHPPYAVWEIGVELFQSVSRWKYRALSNAHTLLSISRSTSDYARKNNPDLPHAQVIHLCIEPPLFEPPSDIDPVVTTPYESAKRKQAVFIFSRIAKVEMYKGHQELIVAWHEVVEKCSEAELWIGGKGDGLPILEKLVATLPKHVAKQIHLLGYLDDHEQHQRFQECRAFAMPSRGEGFGLVFVEAARYGIPCIGSLHDSVKEIVLHNETGLLVEQDSHSIAQACNRLLTDNTLANQLGEAGRQRYLGNFQFHHFQERFLTTMGLELPINRR